MLTASDEFELAKQFKVGVQIKVQSRLLDQQYGREATHREIAEALEISAEQVRVLIDKSEAAKKILVRANMRLVFHIARYYRFRGVAYPDLVQEGTFGLMKAVDKYDPDRGFRFSTYASWWIKQAVSRAIAEKSRIIRLPVHIHDLMVSISKVERQFMDENLYQNRGKMSGNEIQVKDRIPSIGSEPSILNERNSMRSEIRRSLLNLSEREAQIVQMRFGLLDGNPMTLEEIGKQFNVTRERIRQIEARALSKMRHPVKANELKEIFQDHSLISISPAYSSPSIPAAIANQAVSTPSYTVQPQAQPQFLSV